MNYTRGSDRPCWKGGSSSTTYQRIAYDDYHMEKKCSICGSEKRLSIHHKDRDHKNNTKENLVVLCDSCHKKEHISTGEMGKGLVGYKNKPKVDYDMVCILFREGKSLTEISKSFGYTRAGIRWILKKNGYRSPKKYDRSNVKKEEVFNLLSQGLSQRQAATKLGVSHTWIQNAVKRWKASGVWEMA